MFRFVREWLYLMASGDIVDFDEENSTFFLSEHKKMALSYKGKSSPDSRTVHVRVQCTCNEQNVLLLTYITIAHINV